MSYAGYACLMESALALTLTGFALQINSVQETEKKKKKTTMGNSSPPQFRNGEVCLLIMHYNSPFFMLRHLPCLRNLLTVNKYSTFKIKQR